MKSYIAVEVVVEKMDSEGRNLNLLPTLFPDRFCVIDIFKILYLHCLRQCTSHFLSNKLIESSHIDNGVGNRITEPRA